MWISKVAAIHVHVGWMEEKVNEANTTEPYLILYGQYAKKRVTIVTTMNNCIPDGH